MRKTKKRSFKRIPLEMESNRMHLSFQAEEGKSPLPDPVPASIDFDLDCQTGDDSLEHRSLLLTFG
jgi:hypothetical protein